MANSKHLKIPEIPINAALGEILVNEQLAMVEKKIVGQKLYDATGQTEIVMTTVDDLLVQHYQFRDLDNDVDLQFDQDLDNVFTVKNTSFIHNLKIRVGEFQQAGFVQSTGRFALIRPQEEASIRLGGEFARKVGSTLKPREHFHQGVVPATTEVYRRKVFLDSYLSLESLKLSFGTEPIANLVYSLAVDSVSIATITYDPVTKDTTFAPANLNYKTEEVPSGSVLTLTETSSASTVQANMSLTYDLGEKDGWFSG